MTYVSMATQYFSKRIPMSRQLENVNNKYSFLDSRIMSAFKTKHTESAVKAQH